MNEKQICDLKEFLEVNIGGIFDILQILKEFDLNMFSGKVNIKYLFENGKLYIKDADKDNLIASCNLQNCISIEENITEEYTEEYLKILSCTAYDNIGKNKTCQYLQNNSIAILRIRAYN